MRHGKSERRRASGQGNVFDPEARELPHRQVPNAQLLANGTYIKLVGYFVTRHRFDFCKTFVFLREKVHKYKAKPSKLKHAWTEPKDFDILYTFINFFIDTLFVCRIFTSNVDL